MALNAGKCSHRIGNSSAKTWKASHQEKETLLTLSGIDRNPLTFFFLTSLAGAFLPTSTRHHWDGDCYCKGWAAVSSWNASCRGGEGKTFLAYAREWKLIANPDTGGSIWWSITCSQVAKEKTTTLRDHRNSINDCEECLCLAGAFCFRCRLKLRRDIWNLNGNCKFCLHQFSFSKLSHTHTKWLKYFPGKISYFYK